MKSKARILTMGLCLLTCCLSAPQSQAATFEPIGSWDDRSTPMMRCFVHMEKIGNKFQFVKRNCAREDSEFEGFTTPLRKLAGNRFVPTDSSAGSYHFFISPSGDLEVRDRKGVIRTMPSTAPKTLAQRKAKLRSEGVTVGMQKEEVLASSWGKPKKINRTQTAGGVREQWVYNGGYLYFDGDTLVAIQN